MSLRARAVIPDGNGRVLFDRTHHLDRAPFYWLPGGGVEPGETSQEALRRELIEEASLRIEIDRLLYLSENLFVESGEYRHETILYYLAHVVGRDPGPPSDPRMHEWHPPGETPGPFLPPDVAREVAFDLADGFRRQVLHLVTDERPAG
ncbi:MAG TPA: NUDIX domain-containing protein [Gaiellales bacterium]|jgi:ADP-ribose pyrophosphatase YjhB (NUDIX family)|nr:NUDIX domain-containing protein [Gaiellales bacterium]